MPDRKKKGSRGREKGGQGARGRHCLRGGGPAQSPQSCKGPGAEHGHSQGYLSACAAPASSLQREGQAQPCAQPPLQESPQGHKPSPQELPPSPVPSRPGCRGLALSEGADATVDVPHASSPTGEGGRGREGVGRTERKRKSGAGALCGETPRPRALGLGGHHGAAARTVRQRLLQNRPHCPFSGSHSRAMRAVPLPGSSAQVSSQRPPTGSHWSQRGACQLGRG